MDKDQVILQLRSLQREAELHIDKDSENDVFKADYEALDYAIKVLKKSKEAK